jgi:hypothetical protein
MHGIWKMLSGRGEKENRKKRQEFWDAIPAEPGYDPATHPAVSGPLANSSEAFNYRRANSCHGPKSKREHKQFDKLQQLRAEYEKLVEQNSGGRVLSFDEWLYANRYR